MSLPTQLQFSQSNLQDFQSCARRFQLRYLDQLRWPAIESEPVAEAERLAQLGADFHRLVQQHLVGLDEATLSATIAATQPDLQDWWQSYLEHRPAALTGAQLYPELTLSTPLLGHRLLARFDLLAIRPDGTYMIIDWKTSHHKPGREFLAHRMQSRVYPYVLSAAGDAFNQGRPIDPASIRMMYWYPQFPTEPEIYEYSNTLKRRDEQFLSELIDWIKASAQRNDFPLVDDTKICKSCVYRSLCDRGREAGQLLASDEDAELSFDIESMDWDQIAEIQF